MILIDGPRWFAQHLEVVGVEYDRITLKTSRREWKISKKLINFEEAVIGQYQTFQFSRWYSKFFLRVSTVLLVDHEAVHGPYSDACCWMLDTELKKKNYLKLVWNSLDVLNRNGEQFNLPWGSRIGVFNWLRRMGCNGVLGWTPMLAMDFLGGCISLLPELFD